MKRKRVISTVERERRQLDKIAYIVPYICIFISLIAFVVLIYIASYK